MACIGNCNFRSCVYDTLFRNADDKGKSAFLSQLYTTPLTVADFILGYMLPIIPIALVQGIICYGFAAALGIKIGVNLLYAAILILPSSLLFIGMGILCGRVMNEKLVGSICGALFTNICAWLLGTWFDLELVSGAFKKIAYVLPFIHSVELERAAVSGDISAILPHMAWVLGYAVFTLVAAILIFLHRMKWGQRNFLLKDAKHPHKMRRIKNFMTKNE